MNSSATSTAAHERRRSFAKNGYLVLPDFVPAETIDRVRAEADRVLRDLLEAMTAARAADTRVTWWRLSSGQPYVLKAKPVLDLSPAAATLAKDEGLCRLLAGLLGAEPVIMEDKLMYKQVLTAAMTWAALPILGEEVCKHTDAAYFAARGYDQVATVAVCLDECTVEAGALRVWPGTHQQAIEMVTTATQGPVVPDEVAPDAAAVVLTASAGSVLVWDSALVHASGPNTSGHPRRLLLLGYAPLPTSGR